MYLQQRTGLVEDCDGTLNADINSQVTGHCAALGGCPVRSASATAASQSGLGYLINGSTAYPGGRGVRQARSSNSQIPRVFWIARRINSFGHGLNLGDRSTE